MITPETAEEHFLEASMPRKPTQDEFDNIGKFIAVADELIQEPFFSADSHNRLSHVAGSTNFHAQFSHPAFLKSAILPFRKLWMPTEPCAFTKIRDLIYELFPSSDLLRGHRYWFYENHDRNVNARLFETGTIQTVGEVIDIWINTQGAHTGQRPARTGIIGKYTVADFDEAMNSIGRPKFECEFRIGMQCVSSSFTNLYTYFAKPIFTRLQKEGYVPSFEVRVAMSYGAYPPLGGTIKLQDHFWHLDKEKPEETLVRLLQRQKFSDLATLFRWYFLEYQSTLRAVTESATFDELLEKTGGQTLSEPNTSRELLTSFTATGGDFCHPGGRVWVYENRLICFQKHSLHCISQRYLEFREIYLQHRASIISPSKKWCHNWS